MSLRDKAARVNLADLDDPDTTTPASMLSLQPLQDGAAEAVEVLPAVAPRQRTTGVAGITDRIGLHHQVIELQAKVAQYADAQLVTQIDPKQVRQSPWRNRDELSYCTPEFAALKIEIESAGRNVQPIKVRRTSGTEFEVVYGRRRLRACLELGLMVHAIVVDTMGDQEAFAEMDRENRSRANLSAWEQGLMYKDALSNGLFVSQHKLANALNLPQSTVSRALALANLPQEVIDAFPSPLDLQFRWAAPLEQALQADTARVIAVAQRLRLLNPKLPASQVLDQLTGVHERPAPARRELKIGQRVLGEWKAERSGAVSIKLRAGALNDAKSQKLLDFLDKILHQ